MWRLPLLLFLAGQLGADTAYYQRVIFDNSLTPDRYYHSGGKEISPSALRLIDGRLPVETKIFRTGPNALRLQWKSMPQGGWVAEIRLYEWRNREVYFPGNTIYFWCYAPEAIPAADLPHLVLKDKEKNFTRPLDLAAWVRGVPAGKWIQIRIPLDRFVSASVQPFQPHRVNSVFFIQGAADASDHTLIIDDVRIDSDAGGERRLPAVKNLQAKGYERHIELNWEPVNEPGFDHYVIYRALTGDQFEPIGIQVPGVHRFVDFLGKLGEAAQYRVTAADRAYRESAFSNTAKAATLGAPMSDDELLNMVQEGCFRYYWEAGTHPVSGMTRENVPGNDEIVATGASGFGIMALVAAVDRGFVTRQEGMERLLRIVNFLEHADRYHGAWPHFMNGATGRTLPVFDQYDNGADLVETSFLMEGLLTARQYFKNAGSEGRELYDKITHLWNTVEWAWFRRTPDGTALLWHWSPDYSWYINNRLTGWNEVMITYLLAIASPDHGVPGSLYYTGWAGVPSYYLNGGTYYGIKLAVGSGTGGPLFFTDYSYMGLDPHFRDRFADYFENNRHIAEINRAYCIQNPHHFKGYGPDCWGLTAVDGPEGYEPYEPRFDLDDGTIAPTGAISAFAYTPDAAMAALKHFYRDLGDRLWGVYGFRDAFNLQQDWFSAINMGLNQAPMVVMIENHRSGLIWRNFMANPEVQPMFERIGLKPDAKEIDKAAK